MLILALSLTIIFKKKLFKSMEIYNKSYSEIEQLSGFDKAYASADLALRPFYKYDVNIDTFAAVIKNKKTQNINREVLVNVLREQYSDIETTESVKSNINSLLNENTFTITTAHQPSLFTGPLYFIYKTISALNLAEQLKEKYPQNHFVPIFLIGGEDHDFEEINHLNIFGKTVTWENDENGATGMMQTDSLKPVLAEIKDILGNSENANSIYTTLERCFTEHSTYGKAMFAFTNELFKQYGLVVISPNHAKLKELFIPIIKDEIFNEASKVLVEKEIEKKEKAGFKGQAFVREINLFYLMPNLRERIVFEDEKYKVLNTNYEFTKAEMTAEIENYPERFSPNVILRPVYQEVILPNLAYIGGGGELSYWTERQPQFEHFNIPFPMLVRRNSVLWIDKSNQKKLNKLDLTIDDLFGEVEALIKSYVRGNTDEELSLKDAKTAINSAFEKILSKATAIDATLKKTVLGEQKKQINAIENLENRLLKAEKRNQEVAVNQIRNLKDKLFPNNGLQERHDNLLPFYLKYGDDFIQTLKDNLAPLNTEFTIIFE